MEKKARNGAITNRAPLGYVIKDKSLCIDPESKKKVEDIFENFLEWDGSLNTYAEVHGMTTRGLTQLLTNRTYLGSLKFRGKSYAGEHKTIIEEDLFNKVGEKLLQRRKKND
jgi:hypothetical protein